MFAMCKTNCISNDCEQPFFNVNSLDIIRSSLTTPSSLIINFDKVYYEIFLSLKSLFQFFVTLLDNTFSQE